MQEIKASGFYPSQKLTVFLIAQIPAQIPAQH
jgi:hypothetical protein